MASVLLCCNTGCTRTIEGVEDDIAGETVHLNAPFGQPFEKTSRYSCTSRRQGFDADWKEPQAHDEPALADLSQMISPRIKNPISCMMMLMWEERGM